MDGLNTVEDIAESTTAELVEDVVESTTTEEDSNAFGFSENDILDDEPEESDTLLTEGEEKEEPSNTQKRINELTSKAKLAEAKLAQSDSMNKYLLTQAESLKAPVATQTVQEKPPVLADFLEKNGHDSELAQEEYIAAKVDYTIKTRMKTIENEKVQNDYLEKTIAAQTEFQRKSYTPEVMEKFPDFHGTVYNPLVQFTEQVDRLIQTSPQGHAIVYKLAIDEDLRNAVNRMSPSEAGKQIGILEQQFSSPVNRKLKSKSPEPISSVGNKARSKQVKEEDLPIDQFLEQEHKKIRSGMSF